MAYNSRTRDRYRLAVRATTASVAAGAMAATGWLSGAAALDHAKVTAEQQATQAASVDQKPRTILRARPTTTRVTTRYVTAAKPSVPVGDGGTVSRANDPGQSVPAQDNPAPAPPPPPPPPPPAPSNGS